MLGYATVGSNQLDKAVPFYDELMATIGVPVMFDHGSGGRIYGPPGGPMFAIVGPFNGEPATAGNGSMFGFAVKSRDDVAKFHAKALELGGSDEGAPGPRGPEGGQVFMAYVRDLDGNKLCAMCFG